MLFVQSVCTASHIVAEFGHFQNEYNDQMNCSVKLHCFIRISACYKPGLQDLIILTKLNVLWSKLLAIWILKLNPNKSSMSLIYEHRDEFQELLPYTLSLNGKVKVFVYLKAPPQVHNKIIYLPYKFVPKTTLLWSRFWFIFISTGLHMPLVLLHAEKKQNKVITKLLYFWTGVIKSERPFSIEILNVVPLDFFII